MLKIKEIRPLHNMIITTMNKYSEEEMKTGALIDVSKIKNPIKEYQKVIAIGPVVRGIEVGDTVMVNPQRYAKKKFQENSIKQDIQSYNPILTYEFNVIEIDDKECLILYDNDIDFVITKFEEYEEKKEETDSPKIIVPEKKIVL